MNTTRKDHAKPTSRETAEPTPTIDPVGHGHRGTHGPQTGARAAARGAPRLARLLKLSTDVPIDRLCDEAADQLEAKQGAPPTVPWDDAD